MILDALDANLPPVLETAPWMLADGGALDVDRCPDCWERRAHIERYAWACKVCTGMRVLDFGCGVGYGSEMLMEAGNAVTGLDSSQTAVRLAALNHPGPRYKILLEGTPTWDACVAFEVLEHMYNPQRFIDEVPARHLIVSVPVRPSPNPLHLHQFSVERMREMLERRFVIRSWWIQVEPYHSEPSIAIWHARLGEAR
jgi:SAM-dependent methyltransferase